MENQETIDFIKSIPLEKWNKVNYCTWKVEHMNKTVFLITKNLCPHFLIDEKRFYGFRAKSIHKELLYNQSN